MLVQFSMVPLGAGSSMSSKVAAVLRIVDRSGLPYVMTPMSTVIEGSWDEIFPLLKRCQAAVMRGEERVLTTIAIDDRRGRKNAITKKVRSVEEKLGKTAGRSARARRKPTS